MGDFFITIDLSAAYSREVNNEQWRKKNIPFVLDEILWLFDGVFLLSDWGILYAAEFRE